ncbi:MAG: CRISPR-associated endonuclease Csn1 [Spirosomataceae bacterium]|jgi:CRISPR-associated endonuclease Csn1
MADFIIGLDLGVSSIGSCIVLDKQIDNAAVSIFPEGVHISPLGKESSRNTTRREKRQVRRQLFRKNKRRELLTEILQSLDWFPDHELDLAALMKTDPYPLRAKGVFESLTKEEFGRVLFHLSKRRGFKSSRKTGGTEEGVLFEGDKDGTKKGITELQEEMQKNGFQTVGQYLASLDPHEIRIRNRYLLRKGLMDEYEILWKTQLSFHPEWKKPENFEQIVKKYFNVKYHTKILEDDLPTFLRDYVIYYQRKLKSQKGLVAPCKLEPKAKRAPASCLLFQEFRILQKLHDVRLIGKGKTNEPLSKKQIDAAFEWLNISSDKTFKQLKKYLNITDDELNFEDKDKIKGNRTAFEFSKLFGKEAWNNFTEKEKFDRWRVLYDAEDDSWLTKYGQEKWGLNEVEASKLLKISLEKDYAELSQTALKKLVTLMKGEGLDYSDAAKKAGYNHSISTKSETLSDLLGEPQNLRNPIVQQGLFELRKTVNAIIKDYGAKPDKIRIEFARELKMPKKKRENIKTENSRREKERAEIREILFHEFKIKEPSRTDILKYQLWLEADKQCLYTGEFIGKEELYSPNVEIEHIEPLSRSLNDSRSNKTLAIKRFNNLKGNDLPYEMMQKGKITEHQYNEIVERAKVLVKGGGYNKFKRFLKKNIDADMVSRQLNDTAWLAVEARKYLQTICPNVEVIAGQATAKLRHLWGLNKVLNKHGLDIKNRDDHRHHAVDAIVVACTNVKMIQNLSKMNEKGQRATSDRFPAPWDNFRNGVKDAVNAILIKHKIRSRVRGQLHKDTVYGSVKGFDRLQMVNKNNKLVFKVRKKVTDLTESMIGKIGDKKIQEIA